MSRAGASAEAVELAEWRGVFAQCLFLTRAESGRVIVAGKSDAASVAGIDPREVQSTDPETARRAYAFGNALAAACASMLEAAHV